MAITTNVWSAVVFLPFSNAAWTGYTPPYPQLPSTIVDAIINGTELYMFCTDDSGPVSLAYEGGSVTVDLSVIDTETAQATEVTTLDSTEIWYSVRDVGTGAWLWYSYTSGVVNSLTNPAALAAFIS